MYAATITAVAFLAPKGVVCTLHHLALTVRSLNGLELTARHLRQFVALDNRLGLRHAAVAPSLGQQLELVLREALKVTATPAAVRARHARFRKLLADRIPFKGEAPPLPIAPLPADAPAIAPPSSPERSIGRPSTSSEVTGLPSPPPNLLRRGLGSKGMHGECEPTTSEDIGVQLPATAAARLPACIARHAASDHGGSEAKLGATGEPLSAAASFILRLQGQAFYRGQIVHCHDRPSRAAEYADLSCALSPAVLELLRAQGLTRLYSHQATAVVRLMGRGHVMLCTPTASGKSLSYQVPPLHEDATTPTAAAAAAATTTSTTPNYYYF